MRLVASKAFEMWVPPSVNYLMESTVSGVEVTKLINYSGLYLLDSFEVNIQLASIKAIGLTFVFHCVLHCVLHYYCSVQLLCDHGLID